MEEEEKLEEIELNIGDKVKVKEDLESVERSISNGVGINETMTNLEGKIVTIDDKCFNDSINRYIYRLVEDNNCYAWVVDYFEVEKPKEEESKEEIEIIDICLKEETPTDEEIEEMISLVDINTFIQIIKNRIDYDGNVSDSEINEYITVDNAKRYLRNWAKSKYRFYKLFGKKLWTEHKIEVEKDEEFYIKAVNDLKAKFPLYYSFFNTISSGDVANNKLTHSSSDQYFGIPKVKEGMKFTKLVAMFKNNDLNMEVSKMYQDKAVKNIRISIDPCDFLTVSINKHNWRSCHNFFDGEWRNAGLTLLHDKTSLVAYSYSRDDFDYCNYKYPFKWNTKSWRQMIYISENNSSMIFSLQYPNRSDEVAKATRNIIEKLLSDYLDVPNVWKISGSQSSYHIDECCSNLMYNDIGRDGCKYCINKHDRNVGTTIYTGASVYGIVSDDAIEDGESDIW